MAGRENDDGYCQQDGDGDDVECVSDEDILSQSLPCYPNVRQLFVVVNIFIIPFIRVLGNGDPRRCHAWSRVEWV